MQRVCVLSALRNAPGREITELLRGLLTQSEVREALAWLLSEGWVYFDNGYIAHPAGYHTGRSSSDLRHLSLP